MHIWHWQTWQGLPYLTCSLLKDWQHGFFTQQFGSRTPFELVEAFNPDAEVYRVKQVHGNAVLSSAEVEQFIAADERDAIEAAADRPTFPDADGLLSQQGNQAVWVCTADCTPVLIADDETGQVAAIHAGWRGTALGIVPKAVARMLAEGSRIQDLRVAMGPAITGDVYQVSTTVAAQVGATIVPTTREIPAPSLDTAVPPDRPIEATDEILEALRQLPDSPLLDDPQPDRARLDVRRVNALQLEQMGVEPDQIAVAPYCTYQNPELFFSYRRERQKKVQWSGIVSRN
jgi:polyphenol oxidase